MSSVRLETVPQNVEEIPFQQASVDIWDKKYRLKSKNGRVIDATIDETYKRVAKALADVEQTEEKRAYWFERFLWALRRGVIPAGRITSNAGAHEHKPATSTINCTVSGTIRDSMDGILEKVHEAGLTLKAGCGIGYEFSTLRPRGAYVSGAGAYTSGPLSFMDIYDKMCFTVSSAGGRRGAQMATFDVSHPDVREFVRAKREDGRLRQFNLSLLIADDFIEAVRNDAEWPLVFPILEKEAAETDLDNPQHVVWREWPSTEGYVANDKGLVACKVYRRVPAKRLWDLIMASTYDFAEPGFILIDRVNEMNNNWYCENIRATNPCGEQPLPPYGACWTGNMRITTNHGVLRTEDAWALVRQGRSLQIAVDDIFTGAGTDLRDCTLVKTGTKEAFEVLFDNGQKIELTEDHRLYTPQGWKELRELDRGDQVYLQSRELTSLDLVEPFYLGALRYFTGKHRTGDLVITRQNHQAFLKPVLDQLRVNYVERAKGGLSLSLNHPVIRELDRIDPATADSAVLEGYVYAACATAARYKDKPAVYGSEEQCRTLADCIRRAFGVEVKPSRHRKDRFRLLLPELEIVAPRITQPAMDLDFAVYGWLLGDGWLTDSAGLIFSDQDDVAMEQLAPHFQAMTGTGGELRQAYAGQQRDVFQVACYGRKPVGGLRRDLGLTTYRSKSVRVPEKVFRANPDKQASFLSALFCADGSIQAEKPNIKLVSASRELIEDIQLLLLNFGIHGAIDVGISKGNAFFSLCLKNRDCYRFYRYIGFAFNSHKQALLERHLVAKERWHEQDDRLTGVIKNIRPLGKQDVFDIEEYSTHTLVVNGVVIHNCLLGSVNLTRFVEKPFTKKANFNWEEYRETVRVFTRMLDNVVEISGLPLHKQREEITRKRRHGMGFLGLGSTVTMLGMPYGSPESVEFTEQVARELAVAGWETGVELAREKGPAPIMEEAFTVDEEMLHKRPEMVEDGYKIGDSVKGRVLHAKYSRYMQRMAEVAPELVEDMVETGARFTHHSSIAPTGTISLSLANNASNGIEPSFAHHYSRNVIREGRKTKEKIEVYSFELLAYRALVNPKARPFSESEDEKLPDYFVTADDITPCQHVDIQAAAQKWIDSSISKTANVPTDYDYEDFKDIYLYAYEKGLKGCTTFRFNPEAFQGVLVKDKDLADTTYRFTLEDGSVVEVKGNEEVEYDGETHTAANLFDALKEGYYGKF